MTGTGDSVRAESQRIRDQPRPPSAAVATGAMSAAGVKGVNAAGKDDGRRIMSAAVVVSLITIVGKALGFSEKVIIARLYGTSDTADVYFAVMTVAWSGVFLVRELITPSLLPTFRLSIEKDGDAAATLFKWVFLLVLAVSVSAAFFGAMVSASIVHVALPGFGPRQVSAASSLLRAAMPATCGLAVAAVTYTCLNARKRFVAAASGDALFKLLLAVGLLLIVPQRGLDSVGLVMAVAAASALVLHMVCLDDRRGLLQGGGLGNAARGIGAVGSLTAPLVVGVAASHVNAMVDNALACTLPHGQLSYLTYAKKLVDALLVIGPTAIVTVAFSQMAQMSAAGRMADMHSLVWQTARVIMFVSAPVACLLALLRIPLVQTLFQRGQFSAASTAGTADAVLVYALGFALLALEGLFVSCYFAVSDTLTPVLAGVLFATIDIAIAVALLKRWEYLGIAAAFAVAKSGKVIVLGVALRRKSAAPGPPGLGAFAWKLACATVALAGATIISSVALEGIWPGFSAPARLVLPALCGAVVFVTASLLLDIDECRVLLAAAADKIRCSGVGVSR